MAEIPGDSSFNDINFDMTGFEDLSEQQRWLAAYVVVTLQTDHLHAICSSSRQRDNNNLPYGEAVPTNPTYSFVTRNLIPALKKSFNSHCSGSTKSEWLRRFSLPEDYSPVRWLKKNKYIRDLTEHEHQVNSTPGHPPAVNPSYSPSPPTPNTMSKTTMNMNSMREALNKSSDCIILDSHGNPFFYGKMQDVAKGKISEADAQLLINHAKPIDFGPNHAFLGVWLLKNSNVKDESKTMNLQAYNVTIFNVNLHSHELYKLGFVADSNVFLIQIPSFDKYGQEFLSDTLAEIQNSTTGHYEQCRVDEYQKQMDWLAKRETVVSGISLMIYNHTSFLVPILIMSCSIICI